MKILSFIICFNAMCIIQVCELFKENIFFPWVALEEVITIILNIPSNTWPIGHKIFKIIKILGLKDVHICCPLDFSLFNVLEQHMVL